METATIRGSVIALITPFRNNGKEVDYESLKRLIDYQIKNGTDALLVCGTTGESPTLTYEEHKEVIKGAVEYVGGRVPVIAGTGANSLHEALELTAYAKEVGADAALVVVPYYNKPNQEGLYHHYKTLAKEVDIPIIVYNIPGRTCRELEVSTLARLREECPNIIGSKESVGNLDRISELKNTLGEDFIILSGDDSLTLPMMALGADGVVSVANHIFPKEVKEMVSKALEGDFKTARKLHYKLFPLFKALFIDTNPIPVKTAVWMLGLIEEKSFRLPLYPMSEEKERKLREVLKSYGLNLVH
ncbi:MAG TPA: 4-hydroxy-tetrahydrodipicolinate synthase [Aquifex aeolicus]|uniref:4-hydroxy-tetrahydrodipicolinate synthase n=1 Tax=Aquifex aeolicus TaxID=63363 RepID=A0A9D1CG52_AQUAO|nr:4-hydroxy-tetrahydrodipicolinate synthase [Aquificales bacterium]HIP98827.1 4-hydroxy-tetrahydrodipicolinate synthase [Aquifex aeolicus]HIQ26515.1 4-hydroxy-tetrahydrodipicolinate synthase [Aquifex aeolicus]